MLRLALLARMRGPCWMKTVGIGRLCLSCMNAYRRTLCKGVSAIVEVTCIVLVPVVSSLLQLLSDSIAAFADHPGAYSPPRDIHVISSDVTWICAAAI